MKQCLKKNYLQQLLPNSKDFNTALSRLSNHDIKKSDKLNENKYKFTRPIVGELITTMKINFENNYRELEQIFMIFWTMLIKTYKHMFLLTFHPIIRTFLLKLRKIQLMRK